MKLKDFAIRDPFILADRVTQKYYMYASFAEGGKKGFKVYESSDLTEWNEPYAVFVADESFWATDDFWAPEVHYYKGKYYLFGTFGVKDKKRNSQILVADSPKGPFTPFSALLGPENWFVLDATLYVENGVPYALYSHEWLQIYDGSLYCVRLKDDLSAPVGEPIFLFKASESGWATSPLWNPKDKPVYVFDAPFVYEIDGVKFILWSSWSKENCNAYSVGVAYPEKGVLGGKYRHALLDLPHCDCGHAMIFKDFSGKDKIVFHENNSVIGGERAAIYDIMISNGEVIVK